MTTLHVPDSPKMIRETLCVAQSAIAVFLAGPRNQEHIQRLQRLIDECDRHRPLGPDGRHGDRHTPTCGCDLEDPPTDKAWLQTEPAHRGILDLAAHRAAPALTAAVTDDPVRAARRILVRAITHNAAGLVLGIVLGMIVQLVVTR